MYVWFITLVGYHHVYSSIYRMLLRQTVYQSIISTLYHHHHGPLLWNQNWMREQRESWRCGEYNGISMVHSCIYMYIHPKYWFWPSDKNSLYLIIYMCIICIWTYICTYVTWYALYMYLSLVPRHSCGRGSGYETTCIFSGCELLWWLMHSHAMLIHVHVDVCGVMY